MKITILFSICFFPFTMIKSQDFNEMSLEDLLDLEVSIASLSKESADDAPSVVFVFSKQDIENLGVDNLFELLQYAPGFEVNRIGGSADVGVRGRNSDSSNSVLVLLNGMPLNHGTPAGGFVITRTFYLDFIERVEIIRGPGSALYGEGAFVGVVNLITTTPSEAESLRFNTAVTSLSGVESQLGLSREVRGWNIGVTGNFRKDKGDDYQIPLTGSGVPYSGKDPYRDQDFRVAVNNKSHWGSLYLSLEQSQRKREEFILSGWSNFSSDHHGLSEKSRLTRFSASLERPLGNHWQWKIFGQWFKANWDALYGIIPPEYLPENHPYSAQNANTGLVGGFGYVSIKNNLETHVSLNRDKYSLLFGLTYHKQQLEDPYLAFNFNFQDFMTPLPDTRLEAPNSFSDPRTRNVYGAFFQTQVNVGKGSKATFGMRWDDYSDVGGTLNPRGGLVVPLDEKTRLKFLVGAAFRAPTFSELYSKNNPVVQSNPDLDPEKILTYEIHLSRKFGDRLRLAGTVYLNEIEDLIVQRPVPDTLLVTFLNQGMQETLGAEIEARLAWNRNRYLTFNTTFTNPKEHRSGQRLHGVSRFGAAAAFQTNVNKNSKLNLSTFFRSAPRRAPEDPRDRLSSYTIFNGNYTYSLQKHLSFVFTVKNLFNTFYASPGLINQDPSDIPWRGREISLGFSFRR